MSTFTIVSLLVVFSFVSAAVVARLFGQRSPALTEQERARLELDSLLDQLSPSDLKGVTRISRRLAARHDS